METKEIRQRFMAMRNGVVADTLRKAGAPHDVIFGLNVPQLSDIACEVKSSADACGVRTIAEELWADTRCREGRLLACWLFDPGDYDVEAALRLVGALITREEAEMLAFRLLRRLPFAASLVGLLRPSAVPVERHCAEVLARHLES